jgi:hypothetical protein
MQQPTFAAVSDPGTDRLSSLASKPWTPGTRGPWTADERVNCCYAQKRRLELLLLMPGAQISHHSHACARAPFSCKV